MTRLKFGESVYNPADGSWTFPIIEDKPVTDDNLDDVQPTLTSSTPGGNPEAGRPEDDRPADRARFNTSRPVEDDDDDFAEPTPTTDTHDYRAESLRTTALYQAVKMLRNTTQAARASDVVEWAEVFEDYLRGDA